MSTSCQRVKKLQTYVLQHRRDWVLLCTRKMTAVSREVGAVIWNRSFTRCLEIKYTFRDVSIQSNKVLTSGFERLPLLVLWIERAYQ